MIRSELSLDEARRIALTAQGFDRARPRTATRADVTRVIRQLGLVQLDFVNVLIPAHYQVLFSRLGAYRREHLDEVVYRRRLFTEQWAHEASIIPVETWPLLRYRMKAGLRWKFFRRLVSKHRDYCERALGHVRERGPLCAADLPDPDGASRRIPGTWIGSVPRAMLEYHFSRGHLAVAARRPDFSRDYDLAERLIPPRHHQAVMAETDAQRALIRIAARALGIAAAADLADYFRMPMAMARPRILELVEAGELRQVTVAGWRLPAYLQGNAALPRSIAGSALLSPFDPLIWYRPRAQRLFDFDYRFEIFTPPHKRRWGVYVLPFLYGDRLVARLDLKAERARSTLRVMAAYREPHAKKIDIAAPLAAELHSMAAWLGLESIAVERRGDFARPLAAALRY